MADLNDETNGVYGGVSYEGENNEEKTTNVFENYTVDSNAGSYNGTIDNEVKFEPIAREKAVTKQGLWTRIRAFLFQELDLNAPVKVELTPRQQKMEDEINDFLHQEISFKSISNLFKTQK